MTRAPSRLLASPCADARLWRSFSPSAASFSAASFVVGGAPLFTTDLDLVMIVFSPGPSPRERPPGRTPLRTPSAPRKPSVAPPSMREPYGQSAAVTMQLTCNMDALRMHIDCTMRGASFVVNVVGKRDFTCGNAPPPVDVRPGRDPTLRVAVEVRLERWLA